MRPENYTGRLQHQADTTAQDGDVSTDMRTTEETDRGTDLHGYVLDDLRARLVSEHIPPGDRLPSISRLQEQYGVGRSTIRAVLQQLSEERLVNLAQRRAARAAERLHDNEWQADFERQILSDRHNVLSGYFSMASLVPPIVSFALQQCGPASSSDAGHLSDITHCVESILVGSGCIGARLLPLFLRHSAAPYFWEVSSGFRHASRAFFQLLHDGAACQAELSQSTRLIALEARAVVRRLVDAADSLPESEPADLSWKLFPETEHHYHRIALDLLIRMGIGGWGPIGLLPSERRMAEHYSVSVSTIREALSLLDEAGFTRTVNGRGTFATERRDPSSGLTKWLGHTLEQALQAIQLIALLMPVCSREAAERCTPDDIAQLEAALTRRAQGLPIRALFHFIVKRQILSPVRLILARAGTACDWGISVALATDREGEREKLAEHTLSLVEHLRAGRNADFVSDISQLYLARLRSARNTMVHRFSNVLAKEMRVPVS